MKEELILSKGEVICYQDMLESTVGDFISRALPYNGNYEGIEDYDRGIRRDEAYFEGDAEYYIKIIKRKG
jgi:hypothetical protein